MDAETLIETTAVQDGILLIYTQEDGGRITDTGVYLQPGAEHVVQVGKDLNRELAEAFVTRGICAVYTLTPETTQNAAQTTVEEELPGPEPTTEPEPTPEPIPEPAIVPDTPAIITPPAVEVPEAATAEDADSK